MSPMFTTDRVSFNGTLVGPITPRRGLRQGDPLYPYLFLLCVKGLSQSLLRANENGVVKGCKVSANGPSISYLIFTDDSFLFLKATTEEANAIKVLLNNYEQSSGQAINFQKFGIFFSANVRRDKHEELTCILGVDKDLSESRYLGLPSSVGRSKKSVFNFVKERVWKTIHGWNNMLLSRAGKTVLIKNVAQSMPS